MTPTEHETTPAAMTPTTPAVWLHGARLILKHRYGGCYDVVELDEVGVYVVEELSTLPADAVPLAPVTAGHKVEIRRRKLRVHIEQTRRYWGKGGEVNIPELADQILGLLAGEGVPVCDDDWQHVGVFGPATAETPVEQGDAAQADIEDGAQS